MISVKAKYNAYYILKIEVENSELFDQILSYMERNLDITDCPYKIDMEDGYKVIYYIRLKYYSMLSTRWLIAKADKTQTIDYYKCKNPGKWELEIR